MQTVGSALYAILQQSNRDLLKNNLFEFYSPEETDLCPGNAVKRFAATPTVWLGWDYERQVISRTKVRRFMDGTFNDVTVTLSNVDRSLSIWLSTLDLQGWRVLIRSISKSVDNDSIVLGVFRCEQPDVIDNTKVTIKAKQDLGNIQSQLPFDKESPRCPLEFKGRECLGGVALGSHSSAYQAASVCNKSAGQCLAYDNMPAFQGEIFNGVAGNFRVNQRRGGGLGATLSLIGLGNRRVTKQWSSHDDSPVGRATPFGLGRTQIELLPIQSADTGEYLAGQWLVGAGEIQGLLNLRNVTPGWADTFQALSTHMGKYGYDSSQIPAGFFASADQRHSHKAYVEATIKGNNPDTGDPAPTLSASVLWVKIPVWTGTTFAGESWSDNGVEHTRYLITEFRSLNYNPAWIDDVVSGETADYCDEPLLDQTGGEDVYISTSSGTPGTDYKRYRSTGVLDTYYFLYKLGLTSTLPAAREVVYNTFNPASPPTPTPSTYYRKRFTSNWHLIDFEKTTDFLWKRLLPSFNGYITTSAQGKLQIRSLRPAISSALLADATAGDTAILIEDALAWRNLNIQELFVVVGAGLATSESRKVTSAEFSTAGNSITLAATGSATASGATLSGGTSEIQSQGTITVGSVANCTVTVDGHAVAYNSNGNDTTGTIAAQVAVRINAHPILSRYVKASWTTTLPNQVIIRSKIGVLNLATALTDDHDALETALHVHMVFGDVAFGAVTQGNISKDSFQWPLRSRQKAYNQFKGTFSDAPADYQAVELLENDFEHQNRTNTESPLEVGLACVDNYHQADRLVVGARYRFGEGNFFCQWQTTDMRALLLDEGDIVCVNHGNMPSHRNLILRVEELGTEANHVTGIVGRLYADAQFPQSAQDRTIPLTTGVGWPTATPGAVTNLVLIETTPGSVAGTFTFPAFPGFLTAKIEYKLTGWADYADTGLRITPDINGNGAFSLAGLPPGLVYFRVTCISPTFIEGPPTTASILISSLDFIEDLDETASFLETVQEDDFSDILTEG